MEKLKLVLVLALAALLISSAIAELYIWSIETVHVEVQGIALHLTADKSGSLLQYEIITLSVTLKFTNETALIGKTVDFWKSAVKIGSNVTDSSGIAIYSYNLTDAAGSSLDFQAGYQS